VVLRSLQIDSTAVIFCCASNTLRVRWLVFIVYILSCIIYKFFFSTGLRAVDKHPHLALFRADYHRLLAHPAHHVKRVRRTTPKGEFQNVFLHAALQGLFQIMSDLEKPVGRTKPPDALMGALVVVIFHPQRGALPGLLEAFKLGTLQKLAQDRLPKSFNLSQGHRVMRPGADVLYAVLFHLPFKPGLAPPVGVLPPVVGEHLPGHPVLGHPPAVGLENMLGGLTAVQAQGGDIAAVVVQKADQVGVSSPQPEGHDVALPQLVGTRSLEKSRLGRVFLGLGLRLVHQTLFGKRLMNRRGTGGHQEKTLENIGDPARPVLRVVLPDLHHLLPDFGRHPFLAAEAPLGFHRLDPAQPVGPHPALNRMGADAKLLLKQGGAVTLLQEKPDHAQPELDRVGQGPVDPLGPSCAVFLFLFHGLHSFLCNWFLHSGVSPHFLKSALPLTGD
jgi:hypothetical protein